MKKNGNKIKNKNFAFLFMMLLFLGYAGYAYWEMQQNEDNINRSKQEAVNSYPWLADYVKKVSGTPSEFDVFLNKTPNDVLFSYFQDLLSKYKISPAIATAHMKNHVGSTTMVDLLREHINAVNEIHESCIKLYGENNSGGNFDSSKPEMIASECLKLKNIFIDKDWLVAFKTNKLHERFFLFQKNGKISLIEKKEYSVKICNLTPYKIYSILNYNVNDRDRVTNISRDSIAESFNASKNPSESSNHSIEKLSQDAFKKFSKDFSKELHQYVNAISTSAEEIAFFNEIVDSERSEPYFTKGWYALDSGQCSTVDLGKWAFQPQAGIYTEAENSVANYLMQIKSYKSYWQDKVAWGGDFQKVCIDQNVQDEYKPIAVSCKNDERLINLQQLEYPDNTQSTTMYVFDQGICEANSSLQCDQLDFESASIYAQRLNKALTRQMKIQSDWGGKAFPYLIGIRLNDNNGILEPGFIVTQKNYTETPFGTSIDVEVGDEIVSFNGVTIFSFLDFQYAIAEFANTQGVDKLFKYVIRRGEDYYELEGAYFYNIDYFKNYNICSTSWKGLINSLTIGKDVQVLCAAPNVLTGIANGLEAFAAFLSKEHQQKHYEYSDYNSCVFRGTQEKYMLKQFCADQYDGAAFVGMVMSPTRGLINLMLNGNKKSKKRNSARNSSAGRIARDAAIEAVESGVWSVVDMPPGASDDQTIADAMRAAKFGASISFATALIGHSMSSQPKSNDISLF